MDQLEKLFEVRQGGIICSLVDSFPVCRLDRFKVPGAVFIPEQLVDRHQGIGDTELAIEVFHGGNRLA